MRPILAIATTTVGEAIRRKVLLIILLIGILFLAVAPGLGVLSARSETTVLRGMLLGVIQITSAVIAIVLTVYMLPNEIERRTIYTILCKPVQRWQFLVGKYLGAVLALGLMMLLMTAVMVTTFWIQQQNLEAALDLVRGPLMNFIQMSLLAAVCVSLSTFVSPLVNFFLSGGIYLLGTLFQPFFSSLQEGKGTHPVTKLFATVIATVLPNFALYNRQNALINPEQTITTGWLEYVGAAVYGVIYISILLVIGILIFDRREV